MAWGAPAPSPLPPSIRPNLLYGASSPDRITLSPGWEERTEEMADEDSAVPAEQLAVNLRKVR
jgi:hypothetical protein